MTPAFASACWSRNTTSPFASSDGAASASAAATTRGLVLRQSGRIPAFGLLLVETCAAGNASGRGPYSQTGLSHSIGAGVGDWRTPRDGRTRVKPLPCRHGREGGHLRRVSWRMRNQTGGGRPRGGAFEPHSGGTVSWMAASAAMTEVGWIAIAVRITELDGRAADQRITMAGASA
jgi:hypothetical protein